MSYTPNIPIPKVDYRSPSDFSATYTSSSTITLSSLPITISNSAQISYIKVVPSTGKSFFLINGWNATLTISSNVITSDKAKFNSGDAYEVGINDQEKAYDPTTGSKLTTNLNPKWEKYTTKENLVTAAALGTVNDTWADQGSEIPMETFNKLALWVILDVDSSTGNYIQALMKHTNGGTDEYVLESTSAYQKEIGDSDIKILYEFETDNLVTSVQIQTKSTFISGGTITIDYNKSYI
jgi:hypothetical protein